ncbi:MAG TPA: Hsp20/alpha crystallin family protein [Pyrinomonadaceae bacterium]|nr:Hsp20/alpha crystallin family protein [Pyrinomonadaceae bacterium]
MARSIERYLRMMPKSVGMRASGRLWCPSADVYHSRDGWIVKVELAGVSPDEVEVELSGSSLAIRGCRRDTVCKDGMTCQQLEITYSRFEKTIHFPCHIEGARMETDYRDGLLIIVLRGPQNEREQREF